MAVSRYILDKDGNPIQEPDLLVWARWMEETNRSTARDNLPGNVTVSTVFLGLNHAYYGGPPVLWETMIFGGPHDLYQERYTSRESALEGHAKAVEMARGQDV